MAHDDVNRFKLLLDRVQEEIPGAQVVLHQNSRLMTVVHWILRVIFRQKNVSRNYVTTIGRTIYVPNTFNKWPNDSKYKVLRHELIHLRQFRKWPFSFLGIKGLWRINALIFGFCYLTVFPAKITMRAVFEKEAYKQSMLAAYELGQINMDDLEELEAWAQDMEHIFGSGAYFYMARKGHGHKWAYETLELIKAGMYRSKPEDVICQRKTRHRS